MHHSASNPITAMDYQSLHIITEDISNNAFSFEKRKKILWKAHITIPSLKKGNLNDIQKGNHIVFEEIDHTGTLHQCCGLQYFVHIAKSQHQPDIFVIDNHHHALYFREQYISKNFSKHHMQTPISLIHIDQHSDLSDNRFDIKENIHDNLREHNSPFIRDFVNHKCHVGNFIKPFLQHYPLCQFTRIKSESQLLSTQWKYKSNEIIILDIDMDFRSPSMSNTQDQQSIDKIKKRIPKASLVTIATSPYFMDQTFTIQKIHQLLTDILQKQ